MRKKKRIGAILLAVILAVTQLPAVAMAENNVQEDRSIAFFEPLDSGVEKQTVTVGTKLSGLNLPDTVTAAVYHVTEDAIIPDKVVDGEADREGVLGRKDSLEDESDESSIASSSDAVESESGNQAGDTSNKDSGETVTTVTTTMEKIPVIWDSEPAYDGDQADSYVFTADVGGYTLSKAAKLPRITVTVSADTMAAALMAGGGWEAGTGVLTVTEHETGKLKAEAEALLGSKAFDTVKTLNVSGEAMDNNDFETIKSYFAGLETLDFSGCTMTEVPVDAMRINRALPLGKSLKTVVLPDTVTRIGHRAFEECVSLTSINLGEITEIGVYAFSDCESLTGINLAKAASIDNSAFSGCSSLGQVDLSGLRTLGDSVFSLCEKLTLASGSLQKLEGPAILFQTFNICESLGAVTLPPAITKLESSAFSFIPNLELTLEYDGVVEIADRTFRNSTGLTVRVPEGQVEAYRQNEKWAALIASGVDVLPSTSYPITYHLSAKPEAIGFPAGEFPADFRPEQFVGKGNNPDTYTPGVQVTLNPADNMGTTIDFGGWYTDADYQHPITEIVPGTTGPLSLYAKPLFNLYYIYYNPLGGVYGSENPQLLRGGDPWGSVGAATRQNFEFKSWSEQAKTVDGERVADLSDSNKTHAPGSIFRPTQTFTVLYAAWEREPVAATPVAAPAGGAYSEAQTVTLTNTTSGATIYYTLDGSDPVTSGTRQIYSAPFSVPLDTTLKAYATASGYTDSTVLTEAYIKQLNNNGSSSGGGSSSGANTADGRTYDAKKGWVSVQTGIITGTGSGYSKWIPDEKGWKLQYADGTMAPGVSVTAADGRTYERLTWELINGAWYAFGADGYAKSGLVFDLDLGGIFYIDINTGMKTGWQMINGKWYYFNPISDGKRGIMFADTWIDGWYVDKDGIWNGDAKKN